MLVQDCRPIPFVTVVFEGFQLAVFHAVPPVILQVIDLFPIEGKTDSIHHDGSRIREQARSEDLWSAGGT